MRRILIAIAVFVATWAGPDAAIIRWTGAAQQTCLYRQASGQSWLIRCWQGLGDGDHALRLGGQGALDARAHPTAGDTFVLVQDSVVSRAELRYVLALPMVSRAGARRVWLPVARWG